MRYLTIEQRETLYKALETRAAELREEIDAALRLAGRPGTGLRLVNHYEEVDDEELADLQTSLDVASVERDIGELLRVREALERLHGPDYGECVECGEDIPFRRLLAEPAALRCVQCEGVAERRAGETASRL
jgi:RNA polymerase-binding transcription factor DksA